MKKTKFTFNAFILVITIFSAITLFVTVTLYDFAVRPVYEEEYPIEDTNYVIRNSNRREDGLYERDKLLCAGNFGYDWGAAVVGEYLYCNEYSNTKLGFLTSDLVRINLNTFKKETVERNAMLRGRCASGELVCFEGCISRSWNPATNSFRALLRASDKNIPASPYGAVVCYLSAENGSILYKNEDANALDAEREAYYLDHTLAEVMG